MGTFKCGVSSCVPLCSLPRQVLSRLDCATLPLLTCIVWRYGCCGRGSALLASVWLTGGIVAPVRAVRACSDDLSWLPDGLTYSTSDAVTYEFDCSGGYYATSGSSLPRTLTCGPDGFATAAGVSLNISTVASVLGACVDPCASNPCTSAGSGGECLFDATKTSHYSCWCGLGAALTPASGGDSCTGEA